MKHTALPKAMRQQAAPHKTNTPTKTPDVLAQQAALNTVMLGRKGGPHKAAHKAVLLAQVRLKEAKSQHHHPL